jgi:hypothetical protein
MSLDNLIDAIRDSIEDIDQDIFSPKGDNKYDVVIERCKDLLLYKGYKVFDCINYNHINVKSTKDLIEYFYGCLTHYHPEMIKNSIVNMRNDLFIAKHFLKSRMDNRKINKEIALAECIEIITTVFNNEHEFNFDRDLSFSIFGQDKCSWITEKAINIINRERSGKNRDNYKKLIKSVEQKYMPDNVGWDDLDDIIEKNKKDNEHV